MVGLSSVLGHKELLLGQVVPPGPPRHPAGPDQQGREEVSSCFYCTKSRQEHPDPRVPQSRGPANTRGRERGEAGSSPINPPE